MGGNGTAMQEDGILDDSEAKPGATHLATAALVDAVESLEYTRQVLWGYACTIIAESECPNILSGFSTDIDSGALAGIVDGIVDEIAEDAVDERGIALNDDVLRQTVVERHVTLFEGNGSFLYDITDDCRHICTFHRQLVGGIVHAVQRRDVL